MKNIFESVQFLNEFNISSIFKKKKEDTKENNYKVTNPLNDEEITSCEQKIKDIISKHKSSIKKIYNSYINDTNYPDVVKKYKYELDRIDIHYHTSNRIGDNRGYFIIDFLFIEYSDIHPDAKSLASVYAYPMDKFFQMDETMTKEIQEYFNSKNVPIIVEDDYGTRESFKSFIIKASDIA